MSLDELQNPLFGLRPYPTTPTKAIHQTPILDSQHPEAMRSDVALGHEGRDFRKKGIAHVPDVTRFCVQRNARNNVLRTGGERAIGCSWKTLGSIGS